MTILKRPERKQPKMIDVSYGYETSTGARGCGFETADQARKWFAGMTEKCPEFASILKPIKVTTTITKESF